MKPQDFKLNELDCRLIQLALEEDLGAAHRDLTSDYCLANNNPNRRARVFSKDPRTIRVCGLPIAGYLSKHLSDPLDCLPALQDGTALDKGETFFELQGPLKSLLMVERTLLNFIRHLSGIATLTQQFVVKVAGTGCKILDTRKTTPGLRHLEKYAVACGGGTNHRMGLHDGVLIKNNHIDGLHSLEELLRNLPAKSSVEGDIVLEVRSTEEIACAMQWGRDKIDRLLLDNMLPKVIAKSLKQIDNRFATEASGQINLDNVREYAATGVNFVSIGMLTHSAIPCDFSMHVEQS